MKDTPRQQFRWAPHVSGTANVKPRDYEPSADVEAENEYKAWALLRQSDAPLGVGDLLETDTSLRICKYVGFEDARWVLPEAVVNAAAVPPSLDAPPRDAPPPAGTAQAAQAV